MPPDLADTSSSLVRAPTPPTPTDSTRTLVFRGPCTIAQAEAMRETLLEALADPSVTRLDLACEEATEVDLTFLQILIAARRSGENAGKGVFLKTPAQGVLARALVSAGLAHPGGMDHGWLNPFWAGE
ncbi:STAS domain-containing protein [Pararhodospirillum oryzae]|uniref:STAS domain-containing protein n=1 Tax=Pararhodospirillum oryzae TaxID=478448 RepID=A0A512H382_9PROT|nr:STAS domain-containing protein [Pararhodospirillum oryzae]GEO79891.1 hypothetical protein ROR02_00220 [Pararhodospirillum oryzae]